VRLNFGRPDFLRVSPRELDHYFEQLEAIDRNAVIPSAMICATIANVNRDSDRHPEPYTVNDFMPGAESDEENMAEFCAKVARGEKFTMDDEDAEATRAMLKARFAGRLKEVVN